MKLLKRLWIAVNAERWLNYFHQAYTDGEIRGDKTSKITLTTVYESGYYRGYVGGRVLGIIHYLEKCLEESV